MATLSEQEKRRLDQSDKAAKALEAANKKAKLAAAQVRAAARASRKKRIEMIGETIVLAHEAGSLTPQAMATVGGILAARKETPADWALLTEYMPPARPTPVADPLLEAAAE